MADLTYNQEAERAIIARVLDWPGEYDGIADELDPHDFLHTPHVAIWQAMAGLVTAGDAITLPLLKARLDDAGLQALAQAQAQGAGVSVDSEVREVRRCALVRRQLALAGELIEEIKDGKGAAGAQRLLQLEDAARSQEWYESGSEFIFNPKADVSPVWGEGSSVLWAAGEPFILVGPTGVGKTTITQQLIAARMGLRDEVLGYPVAMHSGKILYLASDRPNQIRRAFRRLFGPDDAKILDSDLVVWPRPPTQDFASNPDALYAMARSQGADTVVVDSAKDVVSNLNEPAQGQALNRAFQICVAADVEVLCMHHTRKKVPGTKRSIDDVYGGWLSAGAGSVVMLDGQPGDAVVELLHLKQPSDDVGPLRIVHDHDSGISRIDRGKVDLLQVLATTPGGMTAHALVELESETSNPSKNAVEKMRQRLDRLVREGRAHLRDENGKSPRYVAASPDAA